MADYKPTRMELIKIKQKIVLANKGHQLLKKKRDALIMEFFRIIKKARDIRERLNAKVREGYIALKPVYLFYSPTEIKNLLSSVKRDHTLRVKTRNIMGIKIPELEGSLDKRDYLHRGYSVIMTNARVDKAADVFEEVMDLVIEVAATETAIKRILAEIEKTKRRVNSLEYIMIPELDKAKHSISFKLDELERDSFVSLKVIKRRLEKQA